VGSGSSQGPAAELREQKPPLPPRGAEDPEQKGRVPRRSSLFFSPLAPLSFLPLFEGERNGSFSGFSFSALQQEAGNYRRYGGFTVLWKPFLSTRF